jgi:hypothetical protein
VSAGRARADSANRVYVVVGRFGERQVVAAYSDPADAHALVNTFGEQHDYQRPFEVREIVLNPFVDQIRAGLRCYSVVVKLPASAQVSGVRMFANPGVRRLGPDATWTHVAIVWARDEDDAKDQAMASVKGASAAP